MYAASAAFHTAVANSEPQIALLVFADAIFSNPDIRVDTGIQFDDYFNTEEDISIGQALSNEIRFSLFNDARLLNDYEFGEFKAMVGVRIGTGTYTGTTVCTCFDGDVAWRGRNSSPYLTRANVAVSSQPSFPVRSIGILDGKVYAFGANGQCKVYNAAGEAISGTINPFMQNKVKGWNGYGFNLNTSTNLLTIYTDRQSETYEFVPLGVFVADRPDSPDQIEVGIQCNDRMMKFEKDMPSNAELGISFPITIGTLFEKLCAYVNVPYRTSTFINSTATVNSRPDGFDNASMRTVIGWIAEAAGANAGFDRDGYLVMKWLNSTELVINESGYSECVPVWYTVQAADKIYNRTTSGGGDLTYGTGDRGYLIQDNPLLKGAS